MFISEDEVLEGSRDYLDHAVEGVVRWFRYSDSERGEWAYDFPYQNSMSIKHGMPYSAVVMKELFRLGLLSGESIFIINPYFKIRENDGQEIIPSNSGMEWVRVEDKNLSTYAKSVVSGIREYHSVGIEGVVTKLHCFTLSRDYNFKYTNSLKNYNSLVETEIPRYMVEENVSICIGCGGYSNWPRDTLSDKMYMRRLTDNLFSRLVHENDNRSVRILEFSGGSW